MRLPSLLACRALPLLGALALAACTNVAMREGELGQGSFAYRCLSPRDAACRSGQPDFFPTTLAVGSEFGLAYSSSGNGSSGVIEASSDLYVTPTTGGFRARRAGRVAMLARNGPGGSVLDFTNLDLVAPRTLRFSDRDDGPAPILLRVGERATYWVTPVADDGGDLDGSLRCDWASSEPAALALTRQPSGSSMEVQALAPGKVTLSAAISDLPGTAPATLAIEVTP